MISIVYHPDYLKYCFGPEHPFSPLRLEMLWTLLEALGDRPTPCQPAAASRNEVLQVHTEAYVARVEAASQGEAVLDARAFGLDTPDVPIFLDMDYATRLQVGGTLCGARLIAEGQARMVLQLGGGFHHAHPNRAAGFCIYNDLSIAIRALTRAGLRIAYIDLDVHHADGVQAIHYHEDTVLTISLHETGQYLFPGTGAINEIGEGRGQGFSLNLPLQPFTEDESYLEVFERVVPHALTMFQPDVLVVQCGADAHFQDPLADLLLTTHAYEQLFRRLKALADEHTGGRALFTLGGGYDFDATVRVWTLLYLILQDRPLLERLPSSWRLDWEQRLEHPLTPTLHDHKRPLSVTPTRRAQIALQNLRTAQRLIETVTRYWYGIA
ncbi:acetoin utilization protein AcuC [Rhodothermus profundi]|uniref:Acetoin utilization protein AcuC n=1 Tax=Rhodothermus profundi TaxID=633813 RepID=A0A1M6U1L7_9BACT|nr:acetoin utilization protein AcuC [Rhodothermus profundi]SHK62978.1 acetoin utilization protein AcuC [Rhodothermus profundi]